MLMTDKLKADLILSTHTIYIIRTIRAKFIYFEDDYMDGATKRCEDISFGFKIRGIYFA